MSLIQNHHKTIAMTLRHSLLCAMLLSAFSLYAQNNAIPDWPIIAGTNTGLYGIDRTGKSEVLWQGGKVRKIIKSYDEWIILSNEGIFVSGDLVNWESRNEGLPVKKIKIYNDSEKSFLSMVQEIKDLELHPTNHDIMACATKDRVYLSRDQGRTWTSLGAPSYRTNGIKAVAVAHMPNSSGSSSLTVFMSHSVYGIHYINADASGAQWIEIKNGIERLESTANPDEVSDMVIVARENGKQEFYASQTFRRNIYRLDWEQKAFTRIFHDNVPFGTIDSLAPGRTHLRFLQEGEISQMNYPQTETSIVRRLRSDLTNSIRTIASNLNSYPNCVLIRESQHRDAELVSLSELWLLSGAGNISSAQAGISPVLSADEARYTSAAWGKEGLYMPTNHAMEETRLKQYYDVFNSRGMNMVVIDMKDDYGRLRFTPRNAYLSTMGRVFRPLDLEDFLAKMKAQGIFTVARIVVFKDPEVAKRNNNKYAVWDSQNNKPWEGYDDKRRLKTDITDADRRNELYRFFPDKDPDYEIIRSFYDEKWVDPYSEEVWEYIAALSVELAERGFDEIQYDYIRFPTDGQNLWAARYRWQDSGMDMESAILSFLRHVRGRVKAPISIDIYGANGWYRTGARTGQEVELLAPWVDVICPMYYPSHFEQDFLAQHPAELRTYRIYYLGTLRTARIARGQVVVRPWVQAFYLNVSYDRRYYDGPLGTAVDYVRRQIEGTRNAGGPGFTHWNNIGRYADIPFK